MHRKIIDNIVQQFQKNGYVSEDSVFDALIDNDTPLDQVDYICEVLLSMGVIIKNDNADCSNEDFILDRSQTDYEEIYKQVIEIDESLSWLIDNVRLITPPQNREWINLIPQAQNGNAYAKERLIHMYLRLVIKLALYHHHRYNISLTDAIQDGALGLIMAVEKFEMGKQDNFGQYAPWWIRQCIMREAEPPTSIMRHPVHYKDKLFSVQDIIIQNQYILESNELICELLVLDVITKLECDKGEALELIQWLVPSLSLEDAEEVSPNIFDDQGLCMSDLNDYLENEFLNQTINQALDKLKQRERDVITLRFALNNPFLEPKTLEEVGSIFGVTRERIRQIEAKAIRKIRSSLAKFV